jgi:hypothetical protein
MAKYLQTTTLQSNKIQNTQNTTLTSISPLLLPTIHFLALERLTFRRLSLQDWLPKLHFYPIFPVFRTSPVFWKIFSLSSFPLLVRATWISVWSNGVVIPTGESRLKTEVHLDSIPYLTENTVYIAKSQQLMFLHINHRCLWWYLNTMWGPSLLPLRLVVTGISAGNRFLFSDEIVEKGPRWS